MYQSLLKKCGFKTKDFYGVSFLTKNFSIDEVPLFMEQYLRDEPEDIPPEFVTLELSLDGDILQYCAHGASEYFLTVNPYENKNAAKRMLKLFNIEVE